MNCNLTAVEMTVKIFSALSIEQYYPPFPQSQQTFLCICQLKTQNAVGPQWLLEQ